MRAAIVTSILAMASVAAARPRVQVTSFVVRDEALEYFGPEIARAVTAALEGAGVETGPGAEAVLQGQVDTLPGDRVRLSATLRGRTLTAEGPLEAADAVASQLANQVAPLLLPNDPQAQHAATVRARDAARRAAAVQRTATVPHKEPAKVAAPPAAAEEPAKPAVVDEPAKPEPKPSEPESEAKPDPKTSDPSAPAKKEPEWVPPRVDAPPKVEPAAPPPEPAPYYGGYVRGRVVAHAIADPPSAVYPGAGGQATQALFAFLHRRMRLSVIPTGVGIAPLSVAIDESYRAGARAVVMARLEAVEYFSTGGARVRLEVVAVRDGRPVMRRSVESTPNDSTRHAAGDPVYHAVTSALNALVPELVGALYDVR